MDVEVTLAQAFPDLDGGEPGAGEVGGGEGGRGEGMGSEEGPEEAQGATQEGGDDLGFPLLFGGLAVGEADLTGHQARERLVAPAPEARGGGAGDAGDGGGAGLVLDGEAAVGEGLVGRRAIRAVGGPGEQGATWSIGIGRAGVGELAGQAVGEGGTDIAEGGDREGSGRVVHLHGLEGRLGFEFTGNDPDEAEVRLGSGRGRRVRGRKGVHRGGQYPRQRVARQGGGSGWR